MFVVLVKKYISINSSGKPVNNTTNRTVTIPPNFRETADPSDPMVAGIVATMCSCGTCKYCTRKGGGYYCEKHGIEKHGPGVSYEYICDDLETRW